MQTEIRKIKKTELQKALKLCLDVFMEFEAPDYSKEGMDTFKRTGICDKNYIESLEIYGAFIDEKIVGVIATRNSGSHIGLFFVDGKYHRQGIGTALFKFMLKKSKVETITVNSSPFAKEVYHRFGFVDTDVEQTVGGVRFFPMVLNRNEIYDSSDSENIKALVNKILYEKETIAFKAFLILEKISDGSNVLYPYTDDFARMVTEPNYGNDVFGFRLFCKQAKWDVDFKIDKNIDAVLKILNDDKPTTVRQALAALRDVLLYKPDLREPILHAAKNIDIMKYKETMHSLLEKDIKNLCEVTK